MDAKDMSSGPAGIDRRAQLRADVTKMHTKITGQSRQLAETRERLRKLSQQLQVRTADLRAVHARLKRTSTAMRNEAETRVANRTAALRHEVTGLSRQAEQLRALAMELTRAEQRERERVATLLHDNLQQLLVAMNLVISPLAQAAEPTVQEVGREVSDLIRQCVQCCRSLTDDLSPPMLSRNGLVPALGWLAQWMAEKYQLTVEVQANGPVVIANHETAVLLFRAIRELLFNAVKHAQVQTARVEIVQRNGLVRACVSDAGVGFDPAQLRMAGGTAGGFGLFNIRERLDYLGGGMEVESAPEKGSRFTLWIPHHP